MLLSREELQKMSPLEAEYVYAYIYELYHKKGKSQIMSTCTIIGTLG